jgi:hypothetical protein
LQRSSLSCADDRPPDPTVRMAKLACKSFGSQIIMSSDRPFRPNEGLPLGVARTLVKAITGLREILDPEGKPNILDGRQDGSRGADSADVQAQEPMALLRPNQLAQTCAPAITHF